MEKSCRKFGDPLLILANNPKHPLHVRDSFKNNISWKKIIEKP